MTGAPGGGGEGDDGTVGYGRPPQRSRFKKGKSGNPKGRPRKAAQMPAWARLETEEAVRAIGERRIKGFHKDGRPFSMRGSKAVTHAIQMKALQGDGPSQRYLNKLDLQQEKARVKARVDLLDQAYEWKLRLELKLNSWLNRGLDEYDIPIHPRDIEIDWMSGEVRLYLFITQEQREARDEIRNITEECEAAINVRYALANEEQDDGILEMQRSLARGMIERFNDYLPSRFRRTPMAEDDELRRSIRLEQLSEETRAAARRWTERTRPTFMKMLQRNRER